MTVIDATQQTDNRCGMRSGSATYSLGPQSNLCGGTQLLDERDKESFSFNASISSTMEKLVAK